MPERDPVLQVDGIGKRFSGVVALSEVSFTVRDNEILTLIGPNGAGKTTLFNVIAGSLRPDSGTVLLRNTEIAGLSARKVAALGIGRTFQLTRPFGSMSVLDNIAVAGLRVNGGLARSRSAAQEVLELTQLEQWASRTARDVPTGVLRRLELARALANKPSILLLDEIFAGLSSVEREPVIELLRRLQAEGLTIVMVEHVLEAVMALSDRIVCLDHGEIIASGTPEAVSQDPAVIEAYMGVNS